LARFRGSAAFERSGPGCDYTSPTTSPPLTATSEALAGVEHAGCVVGPGCDLHGEVVFGDVTHHGRPVLGLTPEASNQAAADEERHPRADQQGDAGSASISARRGGRPTGRSAQKVRSI
jgi:hypothetical protein